MSDAGPQLRALRIWAKREGMCIAILERGLLLLKSDRNLPKAEVDLNRRLYCCLLAASRELYPKDPVAPVLESNNQPNLDDETRAAREQKRPDIQWIFLDRYELDPKRSSKQFVVECKRLGKPCRGDWVFNVNYVLHGICRFRDPKWAYAQRFRSGAMVGYCQSMEPEELLKEVNEEAHKNSLPHLARSSANAGGTGLEHTFERSFDVSPFQLHHFWIDLR